MRKWHVAVLLSVLALAGKAFGQTITPTTTLTAETANNTSTADSYQADASGNLGASNISKVDVRTLLYSGATTPVYVHFMGWFGTSSHINVGYTSWDPAQVHRQVDDMLSRGITGAILDWYGPNHWTEDSTAKVLKTEAESRNGQFLFGITEDKGALSSCANTSGCDVTQQLISDLTYAYNNYETSSAYMTVNGRPLVFFFDVDRYTINWDLVAASVPGNPLFIFRQAGGFTKPYSAGSFAWMGFPDSSTDWGQAYLDYFYKTSLNYPALNTFGTGYKGFNDKLASWGQNRLTPQDCGHTWMASLNEIGKYYSSANQLGFIQLVTWNDYEEGTALEMGIDNCVTVSGSMSGNVVNWSITGSEATVDHYTVFISTDGQNLMPLQDVPTGTYTLDLTSYAFAPATYTVYVKAVGKPFLKNQMSAAINYTIAPPPPPPPPTPPPPTPPPPTVAPDFTLSITPASVTVMRGSSGVLTVVVTPVGGFSSAVTLVCSNLPANTACSFVPPSVTPAANAASTTLTIATAATSAALRPTSGLAFAFWFPAIGLTLAGAGLRVPPRWSSPSTADRLTKTWRISVLIFVLLAMSLLQLGCGAPLTNTTPPPTKSLGTPPGTYTITVTATSGTLQHSVTTNVTIQ